MDIEYDELTGLHKREHALAELERMITEIREPDKVVAILYADVDALYPWNKQYGHDLGDRLLRQLADLAAGIVGEKGIVCRYGGDEFLIVLRAMAPRDVMALAEELGQRVAQHTMKVGDKETRPITLTIGVAIYPEHGLDALSLLRAADEAVIQGKNDGGDCVGVLEFEKGYVPPWTN